MRSQCQLKSIPADECCRVHTPGCSLEDASIYPVAQLALLQNLPVVQKPGSEDQPKRNFKKGLSDAERARTEALNMDDESDESVLPLGKISKQVKTFVANDPKRPGYLAEDPNYIFILASKGFLPENWDEVE